MAVSSPAVAVPPCEAKLHSFHSGKNAPPHQTQTGLWETYGENGSAGDLGLVSMVPSMDHQQQQEREQAAAGILHYSMHPSTSGLSRNESFDSVTSKDSCTPSFSTGSPVTVLLPEAYSSGTSSMGLFSTSMSTHGWANPQISSKKSSPEHEDESVHELWMHQEQFVAHCDQFLASPGRGTFSSLMPELTYRYDDQGCVNNSNDFSSVTDLECLVPSSHQTHISTTSCSPIPNESQQQATKSPESVGNTVHSSMQQQDLCQEFLVVCDGTYSEQTPPTVCNSGVNQRSESSSLLSPPSARRRLSWSEYQLPERCNQGPSLIPESLQFNGFSSQAYDRRLLENNSMNDIQYRGGSQENGGSLKRPYSAMQSTCSMSTSAAATGQSSFLNFGAGGAPKVNINQAASNHQQDAAALSALLYKTQGSELMQQMQQAQGTSSSDSARQMPPPKLRRRHGTATDPQSIAARTRRERFSDRIRILQSLVPNGERLDTVSMLGHTLEYVRFLQHQVWQLYNGNDDAGVLPDSECREKWKEFMDAQTVMA